MTCELKTYRLTKEGRRAYRGKLCVSPYLGQDTYASLVDTIATPEDSFELPAAALPFRSVEEVRTKDGMRWDGCVSAHPAVHTVPMMSL